MFVVQSEALLGLCTIVVSPLLKTTNPEFGGVAKKKLSAPYSERELTSVDSLYFLPEYSFLNRIKLITRFYVINLLQIVY